MEKLNARMVVHVYNPSHDEALAINREQYCPSSAARRTAAMFWDVARHWAAPGDFILRLPDDGSLRGAAFWRVADDVQLTPSALDWSAVTAIDPWGWDRHIVGVLRRLGAPDRLLPTGVQLDRIRDLSSRWTAVRVLDQLNQRLTADSDAATPTFTSRWCISEAEVNAAISGYGGLAMLKQPWSCSGRGVWRSDGVSSEQRVRKTLREQGAVEAEPFYERLVDFAMEFYADAEGCVRYEGLSLFETHEGGGYAGNVVAPQSELRRRLEQQAGGPLPLFELSDRLCVVLAEILAGQYSGPLGIDMMLTPAGIHPCIEVNLRNTMGRVAMFQAGAK